MLAVYSLQVNQKLKLFTDFFRGCRVKLQNNYFEKNVSENAPGHTIKITHFQKVKEAFVGRDF